MAYPAATKGDPVSSQSGSPWVAPFAQQAGRKGAGEIVGQVAYAQAFLRQVGMPGAPFHLTNLVFMGVGEPLAN